MVSIVWDMEIGNDPDDLFTLFLLLGHPKVDLRAVTVTPGTPDQIGLVRHFLRLFNRDIPVGALNLSAEKQGVDQWYYDVYGQIPPSDDAEPAPDVLLRHCTGDVTLVTGGPLRNLAAAIRQSEAAGKLMHLSRWVCQGGFAGDGVVPPEKQLVQFYGAATNPTFNLNAHPKSSLLAIAYQGIAEKRFVSKNVCHRVIYDAALHSEVAQHKAASQSLALIWQGMEAFLKEVPTGKKFHDPLAACCAIDESIGEWAEVELYREAGQWGARLSPGSSSKIIIDYDHDKFVQTLIQTK